MDMQKMFLMLLEMMEESDGPLLPNALQQFKTLISFDPGILAIAAVESDTELCTLLHHATAGPARDGRLLEWIMHAGGLHHQPKHCRQPPSWQTMASTGIQRSQLMNALAVHSAAKAGLVDVVRLLLEADQMRDLNTVTFHTRDSLAYIAVQHGHRNVYDLLHAMGADVRHKNAAGKFVYDLTSDPTWKRTIIQMAILQEEKVQTQKSRDPQLRRESETTAEQLRKELADQREAERLQSAKPGKRGSRVAPRSDANLTIQNRVSEAALLATPAPAAAATMPPGSSSSSKSKKKSNKKKTKHGKQASSRGQPASEATNLMQQLVVGRGDDNASEPDSENKSRGDDTTANRVEKLRRALDALKAGSLGSSRERDASAHQALEIVDFLKTTMQHLALGNAKHDLLPSSASRSP